MLETVRAYALERLKASGERAEAQARHAAHFIDLAERAEPTLWGPDQASLQRVLEREHDNLRAALRWLMDQRQTTAAQRLGGTLARFWQMGSYLSEGRSWLAELLALRVDGNDGERARMLVGSGLIASYQGDYSAAEWALTEGVAVSRATGDAASLGHALFGLGLMAWLRGECAAARALGRSGQEASHAASHRAFEGLNLFVQAAAAIDMADAAEAEVLATEGLRICRDAGFGRGIALVLCVLGRISHQQGLYARAQAQLQEALECYRTAEFPIGLAWGLALLGFVAADTGDVTQARALFLESVTLGKELGLTVRLPWVLEGLAQVAAAEGRAEDAIRLTAAADAARRLHGVPRSPAEEAQLERWLPGCRRAVGAVTEQAWAAGLVMSLEAALVEALLPKKVSLQEQGAGVLTPREQEVVGLVARGLTNRQIAETLVISERTAEGHVERIRGKLGHQSRAQLAAWAIENGLGGATA
jgi:DNA-binding CsgD family transcriptional regulator/tetratricopeptide (TPR) repeat protein